MKVGPRGDGKVHMKRATQLDRLGSSIRSGLREHWPVLVVAILGLTWVSLLFGQVYPFPSRTCNDDRQYLGVAHSIARGDGPHKRLIQEHYGGDVANMIALQRSKPEHEHVLGYHFPTYSAILAPFLRLTSGSSFWAVFILNGLLYLTSIGLIYGIAYRLSRSPAVSSLAAGAFLVTPTVSNYVATTMVEMLAIAMGLLLVYLAAKADSIFNPERRYFSPSPFTNEARLLTMSRNELNRLEILGRVLESTFDCCGESSTREAPARNRAPASALFRRA